LHAARQAVLVRPYGGAFDNAEFGPERRALDADMVDRQGCVDRIVGTDAGEVRRQPVFASLPRTHPLNSLLGRARGWVRSRRRAAQERREEIAKFGA